MSYRYAGLGAALDATGRVIPTVVAANTLAAQWLGNAGRPAADPSSDPFDHPSGYNPAQYATNEAAARLAAWFGGGQVVKTNPDGPGAPPPQNVIDFGTGEVFNAGLIQTGRTLFGDDLERRRIQAEIDAAAKVRADRNIQPMTLAQNPSVDPKTATYVAAAPSQVTPPPSPASTPSSSVPPPPSQTISPSSTPSYVSAPPSQVTPSAPAAEVSLTDWCRLHPGGSYNGAVCPVTNPITAPEFPYIGGSYWSNGSGPAARDTGGSYVPAVAPYVAQAESLLSGHAITGIPNWILLLAGAGAVYFVAKDNKRR